MTNKGYEEKNLYTEHVVLKSSTTETNSWTDNAIDVSRYNTAIIIVDITAFDRTDLDELLTLEVEISYDNTNFIHRFTIVDEENEGDLVTTSGDPDRGKLKTTGTYTAFLNGDIGKYLRTKGTLEGTTPSVTLSIVCLLR